MDNIKRYVIDYIEGRVDSKAFIEDIQSDPSIIEWLQSVLPDGKKRLSDEIITRPDGSWYQKEIPYIVKDVVEKTLNEPGGALGNEFELHGIITRLMQEIFPNEKIVMDLTLKNQYNFILDACPSYLLSQDIEEAGILERLMQEFPESMPKTKRIKAFKEKLKSMFYVEGRKYPRWIQESEWPLSKTGKPTRFLRQQSQCNGEICDYYFLDIDTGEEIKITQAY